MRQGDSMVDRSMNYYCAPDDAMDAPDAMAPWARLALDSALKARANRPTPTPRPRKGGPRAKAAPPLRPVKRAPAAGTRRRPQG
jgi:DNA transformation protein